MKIFDELKQACELARTTDDSQLYEVLLRIREQVVELQARLVEFTEENSRLRSEIASMRAAAETAERLVYQRNAYWQPRQGSDPEGPFCSNCWDNRQAVVRMLSRPNPAYYRCPTCKENIEIYPEKNTARRIQLGGRRAVFDEP